MIGLPWTIQILDKSGIQITTVAVQFVRLSNFYKETFFCLINQRTTTFFREYPCDHYTAIINVTLLNTGCPRSNIHETALQLLQILDKRFFGSESFGKLTITVFYNSLSNRIFKMKKIHNLAVNCFLLWGFMLSGPVFEILLKIWTEMHKLATNWTPV